MNCIGDAVKDAHSDGQPSSVTVALRYCSRCLSERNRTPHKLLIFFILPSANNTARIAGLFGEVTA